jgi:putative selenium metabolism hydrolase
MLESELIAFAQNLVRIQSYSGQEEQVIRTVEQQMLKLGYDEVRLDAMGNVLGRIGNGPISILFDAHLDTVAVNDPQQWEFDPFKGAIADGYLHGRGSVDMKSAAAAAVYAGAIAKQRGWTKNKTIYVSCTVFEEDCDGENLKHLFNEFQIRPSAVVICEPSNNRITLGHKGKAQIAITTHGVSAHGAAPEKGINAVYEMATIIQRIEALHQSFDANAPIRQTLVLSQITSQSASLNAVPSSCEAYLDRRLIPNESEQTVFNEIKQLIAGKNASWRFGTLHRTSWTGFPIVYKPFHLAWRIPQEHPLTQRCITAYEAHFKQKPTEFAFWDFSTNAVTPVSMGIPTIGFGPGDSKLAHMTNEKCPIDEIVDACAFYAQVIAHTNV